MEEPPEAIYINVRKEIARMCVFLLLCGSSVYVRVYASVFLSVVYLSARVPVLCASSFFFVYEFLMCV